MTDRQPPKAGDGGKPFQEMIGPAPATGQMPPSVQIGVGFALHQGGAYPSEQILDALERHAPGSVTRVVAMAEKAQQAQIDATRQDHAHAHADAVRGSWQGTGVTVLAMAAAVTCGLFGHDWLAGAFVSLPVLSVARALILPSRSQGAEPPQQ